MHSYALFGEPRRKTGLEGKWPGIVNLLKKNGSIVQHRTVGVAEV